MTPGAAHTHRTPPSYATVPTAQTQLLVLQAELLTVVNSQQLNSANSKAKSTDLRSTGGNIPYSLSEDDGTISSCSFIILPQRGLPRIPPEDPLSPDQTYSNLTFQIRVEDVLYESMTASEEVMEEPSPVTKEEEEEEDAKGQEDRATGAEYACVLKGKKMKAHQQAGMEAGASEASQQGSLATTPHAAQAVQVEEMYSVVRKERKKEKKKIEGCGRHSGERPPQGEMSLGNALVAPVHQESDGRAGHQPSLFQPPAIEPCYESVGCESWLGNGMKPSTEPAYEAVDTYWENSRRKRKPNRNAPAENLYESIENLAFQFQNQNMLAHFEI
ncbi:uncharacterized protein LOC117049254 [Lacerta agilis]|uniref:uncharacterized protein LOC117049254 n=1 Tax=Lacerta agilis TaxID=80427 RepID=UPI001419ED1D|nr:uncharacterized protein LOC117049254 [Lacerta agilis]